MYKLKANLLIAGILVALSAGIPHGVAAEVQSIKQTDTFQSINNQWSFFKGDLKGAEAVDFTLNDWKNVQLPHTYTQCNTLKDYVSVSKGENPKKGGYYRGVGWYRKTLFIDQSLAEQRVFIKFDAAFQVSDVYVNGKHIGNHKGGFTAFSYDITDALEINKENLVAVRVDGTKRNGINPVGGGFVKFSGLTGSARIITKSPLCISPIHYASSGVYVKPQKITDKKAKLDVQTMVLSSQTDLGGKFEVTTECIDAAGMVVTQDTEKGTIKPNTQIAVRTSLSVKNPRLWNGKIDPYLYTVRTTLLRNGEIVDQAEEPFGIRYFETDPAQGFLLNGKAYPLRGVAQHQHWPRVGSAMHKEHFDRDLELMEELNLTSVRYSHYPHSQYRHELSDKSGIVGYSEIPWINPPNTDPDFIPNTKQQLTEMIYQGYNHPSLFFWGFFNEISSDEANGVNSVEITKQLQELAKEIDPARQTCAVVWRTGARGHVTDVTGWNRYTGWYDCYKDEDHPRYFGWIDELHENYPKRPWGITEYGGGGSIYQFDDFASRPGARDTYQPESYHSFLHEHSWRAIKERPYIWATYLWTMTEFLVPGYNEGDKPGLHNKAIISEDRNTMKDAFYYYRANWNPTFPTLHLTSKRHKVRLKQDVEVRVYSSLAKAELFLNGKSQGVKTRSDDAVILWETINLSKGKNNIVIKSADPAHPDMQDHCDWFFCKDYNIKPVIQSALVPAYTIGGSDWEYTMSQPSNDWNKYNDSKKKTWKQGKVPFSCYRPYKNEIGTLWQGTRLWARTKFTLGDQIPENPALLISRHNGALEVFLNGERIIKKSKAANGYHLIRINNRAAGHWKKNGENTLSFYATDSFDKGFMDIGLVDMKEEFATKTLEK